MDSHGGEGQAVSWCQSQDQNPVPSVPDQATLSFSCQLVDWKEDFERDCQMEKRALACFTDFTNRGS